MRPIKLLNLRQIVYNLAPISTVTDYTKRVLLYGCDTWECNAQNGPERIVKIRYTQTPSVEEL